MMLHVTVKPVMLVGHEEMHRTSCSGGTRLAHVPHHDPGNAVIIIYITT